MKKKILGVFASLLVVSILTLTLSAAYAKKSSFLLVAENTFLPPPIDVLGRMEGKSGNRHTYLLGNYLWTGDIEGNGIGESWRFYTNWPTREPVRVQSFDTIGNDTHPATVWLNGDPYNGILTIRRQFYRDVDLLEKGTWVIIRGTDDLANLKGQGKILGDGSFSGMVHFAP
ncbi:hypothetical protein ACFLRN_02880 [Thermoproteota archaeon]